MTGTSSLAWGRPGALWLLVVAAALFAPGAEAQACSGENLFQGTVYTANRLPRPECRRSSRGIGDEPLAAAGSVHGDDGLNRTRRQRDRLVCCRCLGCCNCV